MASQNDNKSFFSKFYNAIFSKDRVDEHDINAPTKKEEISNPKKAYTRNTKKIPEQSDKQEMIAALTDKLHEAITKNDVAETRSLIKRGADVNLHIKDRAALHHAADRVDSNLTMIKLLLEHNADINLQDKEGKTLLHYAAFYNNLKLLELISNSSFTLFNTQDIRGNTALHIATQLQNDDIAMKLREIPTVDIGITNARGITAETIYKNMNKDTSIAPQVRSNNHQISRKTRKTPFSDDTPGIKPADIRSKAK